MELIRDDETTARLVFGRCCEWVRMVRMGVRNVLFCCCCAVVALIVDVLTLLK